MNEATLKALRVLLDGVRDIKNATKAEVERYRRLERQGLVSGVGLRFVSLTAAGREKVARCPTGYTPSAHEDKLCNCVSRGS